MGDSVATALGPAQHELCEVVATNKARKAPPLATAKHGLGYQEYFEAGEALHNNILALSIKLQMNDRPKVSQKKKGKSETNGASLATSDTLLTGSWLLAAGLIPCDENTVRITDALAPLLVIRREWVDSVGDVFDAIEREQPGQIYGLLNGSPTRVCMRKLWRCWVVRTGRHVPGRPSSANKGKSRADGEAMDVGG